ncbi:hypothetical protein [Schlesneria sp. DSM 10557]|uniref:hypothetical protein n=1 Tax=Schlesneria sp. DSM 10557 TaxID=3044399 RepID=UPI0035A1AD8F
MPRCSISRMWPFSRIHSCLSHATLPTACNCACGGYNTFDSYTDFGAVSSCGCGAPISSCAAPSCASPIISSCAAPATCAAPFMSEVPAPSGCNCTNGGGGTSYSTSLPQMSTPTYVAPPTSTPQTIPEIPPSSAPLPPTESTSYLPPQVGGQPQMVSYEEFQRLPGNIISGPGAPGTPAPSPIQQVSAPAPSMTVPAAAAPTVARAARVQPPAGNQQTVWSPVKAY